MNLAGLRVLVTRPAGRADELLSALREGGAAALHIPLLDISELDPHSDAACIQRNRERIQNLDRYQTVIFISANAVQHGVDLVEQFWPQWPAGQQSLAIGEATAAALQARGVTSNLRAAAGSMNSESLLASDALQAVAEQRIAIFRGLGGRETLASVLSERGARVDYIECYRRRAARLDTGATLAWLDEFAANAVVANSGETLANLTALLPPGHALFRSALVVPGERVAALAGNLGYANAIPAANAGTAATLAALQTIMSDCGLP